MRGVTKENNKEGVRDSDMQSCDFFNLVRSQRTFLICTPVFSDVLSVALYTYNRVTLIK